MTKYAGFFTAGLLLMIIPCYIIFLWISMASNTELPFLVVKDNFLQRFPSYLQNATLITGMTIIFLAAACYSFYRAQSDSRLKAISIFFMVVNAILIAWQLFSLM